MGGSVSDILEDLQKSNFRRRFRLSPGEVAYIQQRGISVIADHGREFIQDRLAPAKPKNDGRQTPMKGHPIFVAQHATATCCRGCLAKWHGIPSGRPLSSDECEYILQVLLAWLDKQLQNKNPDNYYPDLFPS